MRRDTGKEGKVQGLRFKETEWHFPTGNDFHVIEDLE
jgi:hypothetical protein